MNIQKVADEAARTLRKILEDRGVKIKPGIGAPCRQLLVSVAEQHYSKEKSLKGFTESHIAQGMFALAQRIEGNLVFFDKLPLPVGLLGQSTNGKSKNVCVRLIREYHTGLDYLVYRFDIAVTTFTKSGKPRIGNR